MSWLSLSDKGKWCPTDLNAFCFSIINIWCWVMSELNASDITSQPCKMQHSVETWTFPLAGRDARYGCGYEALQLHSSVLDQQRNSAQLFPLHITINLNTAMLEEYSTDSCHDTVFLRVLVLLLILVFALLSPACAFLPKYKCYCSLAVWHLHAANVIT